MIQYIITIAIIIFSLLVAIFKLLNISKKNKCSDCQCDCAIKNIKKDEKNITCNTTVIK